MEWLEGLNLAVKYLEENLDGTIEYEEAARLTCCSVYHFQKIFMIMTDIPLGEYIRCRRLARAAEDLRDRGMKVLDVGLKYGYSSPTAFNRAFQAMHGVTPSKAKERAVMLKAYPPISFKVSVRGAVEMKHRIVELGAFQIVGMRLNTTFVDYESFQKIPQFWGWFHQQGKLPFLEERISDEDFPGILGVSCGYRYEQEKGFDYYIGVADDGPLGELADEGFEVLDVPASIWAVFECVGAAPASIQEMERRMVSEWLPSSGYDYGNAPDIELYLDRNAYLPTSRAEIWMPVIKRKSTGNFN